MARLNHWSKIVAHGRSDSNIDARDSVQAVRKALGSRLKGAEAFLVADADTVMLR